MAGQTLSTETQVVRIIIAQKLAGASLRAIAKTYGPHITHCDISRALKGEFPKSCAKRLALGLPALAPAPVCIKCGLVHVTKRCTNNRKPSPVWRDGAGWWRRYTTWMQVRLVQEWT